MQTISSTAISSYSTIVSTLDITGTVIPEKYAVGVINAPEGASLTAIFSRNPENGRASIDVVTTTPDGQEFSVVRRSAGVLLQCLSWFGSRETTDWVKARVSEYRADIDRLNASECPDGYQVYRAVNRSIGTEWLTYRDPNAIFENVKSCPHQYSLLM